jgi:hypothetical protein
MGYYCNICKKVITKAEFFYSKDKFNRALCREHQELERRTQEKSFRFERQEGPIAGQELIEIDTKRNSGSEEISSNDAQKSGWKSVGKKVAVKMGKGVVKGAKKIVNSSKKALQKRKWKDDILRRMTMGQLKRLCFEKKVDTKEEVLMEDESSGERYWKELDYSQNDLVSRLKNKIQLDAIISFAKRNRINIKDVLADIERKKNKWKEKELDKRISKNGNNFLLELEKAIMEFAPMRRYDKELYYQDTLASFLKKSFPDTKIEVPRGSTRPDIVVKGIAIEVKGPTSYRDLQSIADKCLRYTQNFPNGMICVLFSVNINEHRYEEWLKGMNKYHPDVKVIKISQ